jgi:hypothetical protein
MDMEPESAAGMRLIGHDDLGGRGNVGEGIGLHVSAGRRTLYLAHESSPVNFSVVDVGDPRAPRLVQQTVLPHEGLRSNSLAVAGDVMVVCYQEGGRWRGPRLRPVGLEIFDLSRDPHHPRSIGFWDASGPHSRGTHCVWFVDGQFAYLSTGTADSRPTHPRDDQFVVILDLADPTRPVEVGRWWLPGTQEGDDAAPPDRHPHFDSGFRAHNVNVYPERPDRAYCGYIDAGVVILDIADRARPRLVSRLDYHPPMPGFTHTAVPLLSRGLLAVTDETVQDGGADWPKPLWLMDVSVESNPTILGTAPLPIDELRGRGGRAGAHNLHENDPTGVAWRSDDYVVGAFFNGGVRAYDVRDPFHPREVGHLVPAPPPRSPAGAAQINDVFVDENRLIYAVDRYTGGLYLIEADF